MIEAMCNVFEFIMCGYLQTTELLSKLYEPLARKRFHLNCLSYGSVNLCC